MTKQNVVKDGRERRRVVRALHARQDDGNVPVGWPREDGSINFGEEAEQAGDGKTTPSSNEPSGLQSRRLRSSPRGPSRKRLPAASWPSGLPLHALKSLDIVSFNLHSERFFVDWLANKITESEYACVTVAWVLANAAFELDLSIETIKRYVAKHTADRAEFHSDGTVLTIRD